jgi:hypothetical protein
MDILSMEMIGYRLILNVGNQINHLFPFFLNKTILLAIKYSKTHKKYLTKTILIKKKIRLNLTVIKLLWILMILKVKICYKQKLVNKYMEALKNLMGWTFIFILNQNTQLMEKDSILRCILYIMQKKL